MPSQWHVLSGSLLAAAEGISTNNKNREAVAQLELRGEFSISSFFWTGTVDGDINKLAKTRSGGRICPLK